MFTPGLLHEDGLVWAARCESTLGSLFGLKPWRQMDGSRPQEDKPGRLGWNEACVKVDLIFLSTPSTWSTSGLGVGRCSPRTAQPAALVSAEINQPGELVMESRLITVSSRELDAEAAVYAEFPQFVDRRAATLRAAH